MQIVQGAETPIDVAKIADRVATVARTLRTGEDGQDVNQVHAELRQVRQVRLEPLEVAGKAVAVQRHSDDLLTQEPVVVLLAGHVDVLQILGAVDIGEREPLHEGRDLREKILAMAVQLREQGMDGVEIRTEARVEMAQVLAADVRLQLIEDIVQQCV